MNGASAVVLRLALVIRNHLQFQNLLPICGNVVETGHRAYFMNQSRNALLIPAGRCHCNDLSRWPLYSALLFVILRYFSFGASSLVMAVALLQLVRPLHGVCLLFSPQNLKTYCEALLGAQYVKYTSLVHILTRIHNQVVALYFIL